MATSKKLMDEINDQFLICKICYDIYRRPKSLSCLHNFCAACLDRHLDAQEERAYRYMLYSREITCPICRTKTELPSGGVCRLPDNFLLENLIDVVRRRPQTSDTTEIKKLHCEICKANPALEDIPAVTKCLDCSKLLCENCVQLHRKTNVTRNHSLIDVDVQKDIECKVHENEVLRFFCEPCAMCICVLCTFQEHKGHEVSSFAEGISRHKHGLDGLLEKCRQRIALLRHQEHLIERCESNLKKSESLIHEMAASLVADVRRKESEMVEDLYGIYGDNALNFLKNKEKITGRIETLQNTHNLADVIIKEESIELLLLKTEIQGKFQSLLSTEPTEPPRSILKEVEFRRGKLLFGYFEVDGVSCVSPEEKRMCTFGKKGTSPETQRSQREDDTCFRSTGMMAVPDVISRQTMTAPTSTMRAKTQTERVKYADQTTNTRYSRTGYDPEKEHPEKPVSASAATQTDDPTTSANEANDTYTETHDLIISVDQATTTLCTQYVSVSTATDTTSTCNKLTCTADVPLVDICVGTDAPSFSSQETNTIVDQREDKAASSKCDTQDVSAGSDYEATNFDMTVEHDVQTSDKSTQVLSYDQETLLRHGTCHEMTLCDKEMSNEAVSFEDQFTFTGHDNVFPKTMDSAIIIQSSIGVGTSKVEYTTSATNTDSASFTSSGIDIEVGIFNLLPKISSQECQTMLTWNDDLVCELFQRQTHESKIFMVDKAMCTDPHSQCNKSVHVAPVMKNKVSTTEVDTASDSTSTELLPSEHRCIQTEQFVTSTEETASNDNDVVHKEMNIECPNLTDSSTNTAGPNVNDSSTCTDVKLVDTADNSTSVSIGLDPIPVPTDDGVSTMNSGVLTNDASASTTPVSYSDVQCSTGLSITSPVSDNKTETPKTDHKSTQTDEVILVYQESQEVPNYTDHKEPMDRVNSSLDGAGTEQGTTTVETSSPGVSSPTMEDKCTGPDTELISTDAETYTPTAVTKSTDTEENRSSNVDTDAKEFMDKATCTCTGERTEQSTTMQSNVNFQEVASNTETLPTNDQETSTQDVASTRKDYVENETTIDNVSVSTTTNHRVDTRDVSVQPQGVDFCNIGTSTDHELCNDAATMTHTATKDVGVLKRPHAISRGTGTPRVTTSSRGTMAVPSRTTSDKSTETTEAQDICTLVPPLSQEEAASTNSAANTYAAGESGTGIGLGRSGELVGKLHRATSPMEIAVHDKHTDTIQSTDSSSFCLLNCSEMMTVEGISVATQCDVNCADENTVLFKPTLIHKFVATDNTFTEEKQTSTVDLMSVCQERNKIDSKLGMIFGRRNRERIDVYQAPGMQKRPMRPVSDSPRSNLSSIMEEQKESSSLSDDDNKIQQQLRELSLPAVSESSSINNLTCMTERSPRELHQKETFFVPSARRLGVTNSKTNDPTNIAKVILAKVETGTNTAEVKNLSTGTCTVPVDTADKAICTEPVCVDNKMAECISKLKTVRERLEVQPLLASKSVAPMYVQAANKSQRTMTSQSADSHQLGALLQDRVASGARPKLPKPILVVSSESESETELEHNSEGQAHTKRLEGAHFEPKATKDQGQSHGQPVTADQTAVKRVSLQRIQRKKMPKVHEFVVVPETENTETGEPSFSKDT